LTKNILGCVFVLESLSKKYDAQMLINIGFIFFDLESSF